MKKQFANWSKEIYTHIVGEDTYFFYYPDPDLKDNGYTGVATAWKENDEGNSFLVPYWVKYKLGERVHENVRQRIREQIENILKKKK